MLDGKPLNLLGRDRKHRSIIGDRPLAQAHYQPTARLQQRHKLAERSAALAWQDVHPYGTEPYEIGQDAPLDQPFQRRQSIAFPTDSR